VRQETFARFYAALRDGKILHPERLDRCELICNNVLLEHYRANSRHSSLDDDEQRDLLPPCDGSAGILVAKRRKRKSVDSGAASRTRRRLLREVFLEERDKEKYAAASVSTGVSAVCCTVRSNRLVVV